MSQQLIEQLPFRTVSLVYSLTMSYTLCHVNVIANPSARISVSTCMKVPNIGLSFGLNFIPRDLASKNQIQYGSRRD